MLQTLFRMHFHSATIRAGASRQLKAGNVSSFITHDTTDAEVLRQLFIEIDRLTGLAHDEDQTNRTLCTIVSAEVEGDDWVLQEQAQSRIKDHFTVPVEAMVDLVQRYKAHKRHWSQNVEKGNEQHVIYQEGEEYNSDESLSASPPDEKPPQVNGTLFGLRHYHRRNS